MSRPLKQKSSSNLVPRAGQQGGQQAANQALTRIPHVFVGLTAYRLCQVQQQQQALLPGPNRTDRVSCVSPRTPTMSRRSDRRQVPQQNAPQNQDDVLKQSLWIQKTAGSKHSILSLPQF